MKVKSEVAQSCLQISVYKGRARIREMDYMK